MRMCSDCCPHGIHDPCTCDGCWACSGHVVGCTCDIAWDCEHDAHKIAWSNPRETNNTPQPKGNPNANR